jgi:hypothetical protein
MSKHSSDPSSDPSDSVVVVVGEVVVVVGGPTVVVVGGPTVVVVGGPTVVVGGAPLVVVVGGAAVVVGGAAVGGEPIGVNFRNPIAPPNVSLSTKTITSPLLGSTAKYSPALFPALSP